MNKCIKCGILIAIVMSPSMIIPDHCNECEHKFHKEHHLPENYYGQYSEGSLRGGIAGAESTISTDHGIY